MLQCGERFRLERLMGAPQIPSWSLIGGSVVHEVTETLDRLGPHGGDVEALCEQVFDKYIADGLKKEPDKSRWHQAGRANAKEDEAWWRRQAPVFVYNWLDWLEETPMHIDTNLPESGIEIEIEVDQYGTPLKGGIDRILYDPHAQAHLIVDLKSGSREPKSPFQLAIYRDAMLELHGLHIKWGAYFMVRTGKLSQPFDLDLITPDHTLNLIAGTRQMAEQGIFIPNPSMLCSSCGVKDYCYAVGGDPGRLPSAQ
jgi:hypothetical protein